MSAIASFYLINTNKLEGLRQNAEITVRKTFFGKKTKDTYCDFLKENAVKLADFDGSGYVFGNLFPFLEEKGIDLPDGRYANLMEELGNKRGCSHCIISFQSKEKYIWQLEHADFSLAEVQSFNEKFSGEGEEEYAMLALKGINALVEAIGQIDDNNQVLLLIIG